MSRRIRRTPYTSCVEKSGISGFTVVNHTLLPKAFQHTTIEDYYHLRENVQIWDVGCQRQVQIKGPDSAFLVQKITPRDLRSTVVGECLYVPLINDGERSMSKSFRSQIIKLYEELILGRYPNIYALEGRVESRYNKMIEIITL